MEEGVCAELDSVLLELVDCLEELQAARKKYDSAVSEGYFCMAKARYSMPPKSVSSLQYDSVLTPLVHADTLSATAPPCCYEEIPVGGRLEPAFSVRRVKEKGTGKLSSSEEGGDGLRRRTGGGVEELAAEMEGLAVGEKLKDPLTMFGVLVPQSLRLSQQYFIQAVQVCGEMANSQLKLETLRRRYRQLMAEKLDLQSETAT